MTTYSKETYTSKYSIIETEDGFRVEGRDRHTVYVRLAPSKTALQIAFDDGATGLYRTVNLYAYHALLEAVANVAMSQWQPPADRTSDWGGIHAWAISRTKLAMGSRIYGQWQRVLAKVPETRRNVAKAVFAATFDTKTQGCEAWDELYDHPYLIKDILNYRAAAIACHYALSQVQFVGKQLYLLRQENPTFVMSCYQEQLLDFYTRSFDPTPSHRTSTPFDPDSSKCRRELVSLLAQDWKSLFSRTGEAGTSLRRTLMNLPGGISGYLLRQFPLASPLLSRPITDRVELTVLLSFAARHYEYHSEDPTLPMCNVWETQFYVKAQRSVFLLLRRGTV